MKLFILKQPVIDAIKKQKDIKLAVMKQLEVTDSRSITSRIKKHSQSLTQINVLTVLSHLLGMPIHELYQEK